MDPTTSTLGRARAESPPTHGDRRDRIRAAQQARPSPPVVHIYAEPMARSIDASSRSSPLTAPCSRCADLTDTHCYTRCSKPPTKSPVRSRISSPATNSGPGQDSTRSMS